MSIENVLEKLRERRGEFVLDGWAIRHKEIYVDPPNGDFKGLLACPMAVLCKEAYPNIKNYHFELFQKHLGLERWESDKIKDGADWPHTCLRNLLLEAVGL